MRNEQHPFQEILIFTNTRFASREFQSAAETKKSNTPKEVLKEACWNGVVADFFPEICIKSHNPAVGLWEINDADSFLELQYGLMDERWEIGLALNPYLCLMFKEYN
jgi:hypothetical protein